MLLSDSINEFPAFTWADVDIAVGPGCDATAETADVVLVYSNLK